MIPIYFRYHLLPAAALLLAMLPATALDETPAAEPSTLADPEADTDIRILDDGDWSIFDRGPVRVSGYGVFGDFSLERTLAILRSGETRAAFDRAYVEDAAWVLVGRMRADGYLEPRLDLELEQDGSTIFSASWEDGFSPRLPTTIEADRIRFKVHPGVLFYYNDLTISGVTTIAPDDLTDFFYAAGFLFVSRRDRFFTPARLDGSIGNILQTLRQQGYRRAAVSEQSVTINSDSGAVDVTLEFKQGPLYHVRTLDPAPGSSDIPLIDEVRQLIQVTPGQVYTQDWQLRLIAAIRTEYFHAGYPDVNIRLTTTAGDLEQEPGDDPDTVTVDLAVVITPGNQITVGDIRFEGTGSTRQAVLDRQLDYQSGDLLNVDKVRLGRDQLSGLGIFETVRVRYQQQDDYSRDVIYETQRIPDLQVSPIIGFGSFDIVRGGVELDMTNLWGRAHRSRIRAIQSIKTTQLDYLYRIPQIIGHNTSGYFTANYLDRQEISFTRREQGATIGVDYYLPGPRINLAMQYNYQQLNARQDNFDRAVGRAKATATSIEWIASLNRLDSPIYPENGYQLFTSLEVALPELGGDVEYQRLSFGSAWHHPLLRSLIFHSAFRHGFINTFGDVPDNIPFNKRFFLGGENTVRGYRRGQASPFDRAGNSIGSATYMLLNLQLEQKLSSLFSASIFVDSIGIAREFSEYPFNKVLVSAGAGISLNTIVGPIRVEYGHNLNPRPQDPDGTLQIAIGFPF